jgi:hypothetical protein
MGRYGLGFAEFEELGFNVEEVYWEGTLEDWYIIITIMLINWEENQ